MLWPVVFIMTDVINEHFGVRGVRLISWLAVAFIVYAFLFAYLAIGLAPAGWWLTVGAERGVPDMQAAFANIFGQGLWTIGGSVTAFLVGQLIDVTVFQRIRAATGERWVWLRATGSTAVSQLIDSFIVLYIAFVLGPQHWPIPLFLAVGTVNYALQDGDGDRADPAAVPRPAPDPRLPRPARGGRAPDAAPAHAGSLGRPRDRARRPPGQADRARSGAAIRRQATRCRAASSTSARRSSRRRSARRARKRGSR